jgi:GTP-binding protein
MLIDEIELKVKAGSGGNGAATFKRNAQTSRGGPDGGNGGNGGNLYIQGINDIQALSEFRYKKEISAEDGIKGAKQNLYGRNGKDTIIKMPIGSRIHDESTGENWEIENETDKVLIAKGGKGGRGNNEFKTATNQAPTYAEKGQPGEERTLHIELRLIADVGLIGLPNAGKSSLLEALTNAKPKIGNYPFTTLEPNLGVMNGKILADIPGLIEGASQGKGLGIKFLRHIEKTNILLHCIDSTGNNLFEDYNTVRNELQSYNPALLSKPEIILLTKSDMIDATEAKIKAKELKKLEKDIILMSVYDDSLLEKLQEKLE